MTTLTRTSSLKSHLIQVRVDEQTKASLEQILSTLGLSTSQAFLMYIKQILLKRRIPFDLSIAADFDDRDLSSLDFNKLTAKLVTMLDEDEEIPEFHNANQKKFEW
jgi:addiction module RelB/DinJ family antitoxin